MVRPHLPILFAVLALGATTFAQVQPTAPQRDAPGGGRAPGENAENAARPRRDTR